MALVATNPSAMPIWPPAGVALAALVLRGLRLWPAIFLAASLASMPMGKAETTIAGESLTALAIAAGNTSAAVVGGVAGQPLVRRPQNFRHAARCRKIRPDQLGFERNHRSERARLGFVLGW
jgi:integral membrane sensor domain MASE1